MFIILNDSILFDDSITYVLYRCFFTSFCYFLDILAIQITTVASESAFSTGGRVFDPYRTNLSYTVVEAFICTKIG